MMYKKYTCRAGIHEDWLAHADLVDTCPRCQVEELSLIIGKATVKKCRDRKHPDWLSEDESHSCPWCTVKIFSDNLIRKTEALERVRRAVDSETYGGGCCDDDD